MSSPLSRLRALAVSPTLLPPVPLEAAMCRLGFVQADPIRSPATARDLILRHRVEGYRAGDLDRHYGGLSLEEDYLYTYGSLPRRVRQWLHPRHRVQLTAFQKKVLAAVQALGRAHPRDLGASLGCGRVTNAWGGNSKATTQALEELHFRGVLRVYGLGADTRVCEPVSEPEHSESPEARLRRIVLVAAGVLAPVRERRLRAWRSRRGSWPHSTWWYGIAIASSISGAGPTASRPRRRAQSARGATMRCRSSGETA